MFDWSNTSRIDATATDNIRRAINKAVKAWNTKALTEMQHVVLVACIDHAKAHSMSFDLLSNYFAQLPANAPVEKINRWVRKFIPDLAWSEKKQRFIGKNVSIIVGYDATPFWTVEKVKPEQIEFHLPTRLASLLDKAEKDMKARIEDKKDIPQSELKLLDTLAKALETYRSDYENEKAASMNGQRQTIAKVKAPKAKVNVNKAQPKLVAVNAAAA